MIIASVSACTVSIICMRVHRCLFICLDGKLTISSCNGARTNIPACNAERKKRAAGDLFVASADHHSLFIQFLLFPRGKTEEMARLFVVVELLQGAADDRDGLLVRIHGRAQGVQAAKAAAVRGRVDRRDRGHKKKKNRREQQEALRKLQLLVALNRKNSCKVNTRRNPKKSRHVQSAHLRPSNDLAPLHSLLLVASTPTMREQDSSPAARSAARTLRLIFICRIDRS